MKSWLFSRTTWANQRTAICHSGRGCGLPSYGRPNEDGIKTEGEEDYIFNACYWLIADNVADNLQIKGRKMYTAFHLSN